MATGKIIAVESTKAVAPANQGAWQLDGNDEKVVSKNAEIGGEITNDAKKDDFGTAGNAR